MVLTGVRLRLRKRGDGRGGNNSRCLGVLAGFGLQGIDFPEIGELNEFKAAVGVLDDAVVAPSLVDIVLRMEFKS